eukprot:82561_1
MTHNNNNKKRSMNDAELDDNQYDPPNKKQKIMHCHSPTNMEMITNFMQDKPEEFKAQTYENIIKSYEKYSDEQLIKQFKIPNQNQKQFLSLFKGIHQSKLSKLFCIPQVIISEIAQYAIGKIFVCAHNVCDKKK